MNKYLLTACIVSLGLSGFAQADTEAGLAYDQNPQFEVSRARYMNLADSLIQWHSTTPQETYKAIDYLADRREARLARQAFRDQLRLIRAERGGYYYDDYYYDPYYSGRPWYHRYNHYQRFYPGYSSNYYRIAIPAAFLLGLWCR